MKKRSLLLLISVLLCFSVALSRLGQGNREAGRQQLEETLRRTAVALMGAVGTHTASNVGAGAHL